MRAWPCAAALTLLLAACGGDDDSASDTTAAPPATADATTTSAAAVDTTAAPETTAAPAETTTSAVETTVAAETSAAAGGSLRDVCPERIVLQTNWFPEAEHGGTYQLIGTEGTIDTERGAYSGPLAGTDVELEIRVGGPYIGFQNVTSLMYQDPDIFLGFVDGAESIELSGEFPTVGVMAPLQISPLIFMFDPATYDFQTVEDIRESGATVLYFEGDNSIEYFLGTGQLTEEQLDASFDGSPARFVAENGAVVQQGFVTHEPFLYETAIAEWMKPVGYILMHDAGYTQYQSALSVLPETLAEEGDCLARLVPIMQQGWVEYMADPEPINTWLVDYVTELATFWTLTAEANADGTAKMAELGIVANGPDGAFGSFDLDRTQLLIDLLAPVFIERGLPTAEGLTAADVATNEYLDPAIALP